MPKLCALIQKCLMSFVSACIIINNVEHSGALQVFSHERKLHNGNLAETEKEDETGP